MELDALYKLTHGLYILGAADNGRPVGSVVDAVMQVANKPVVIALSCNNQSYTKECIERTGVFGLSVLCKGVDPFVIANFGFQSSRSIDKWENVDYCIRDGVPYLNDNIATVRCKVLQSIKYDSNTLFIAEVQDCANGKSCEPLTYMDYRSYFKDEVIKRFNEVKQQKEKKMAEDKNEGKHWVCTVCGYVYDGEIPFEDLPDDWVCPLCGVDKSFLNCSKKNPRPKPGIFIN